MIIFSAISRTRIHPLISFSRTLYQMFFDISKQRLFFLCFNEKNFVNLFVLRASYLNFVARVLKIS